MKISELRIETRHFVVGADGCPIGPMQDFYYGSASVPPIVARNGFPFKIGQKGFLTVEEAQDHLDRLVDHMKAVLSVEPSKRIGASKFWAE